MNKNGMGLRISTTNQEGKMATWESGLKEILEMLQRKRAGVEKGLATKAANRGTERSDFTTGMHDGKASETTEKEQDRIYRIMTEELNASDERHLILNANINGMNAEVILDEGAQACCMSLQEARRLKIGITSGRRSLKGLGDHTTHAWLSEPTSFQLGTKKIQLLFHILSTPSPTLISIGAQRSLGIDKLLSQNKLMIGDEDITNLIIPASRSIVTGRFDRRGTKFKMVFSIADGAKGFEHQFMATSIFY
eukprot:Blabericola_migrator_1__4955@NODE_2580_length_2577_cov_117_228685_g1552_i3_p3_GENE_NODE_2580_length_2577_cov_117_228685_g1552_i3NODE_2580_length_2577_cov_117_228685_g1552_i3_p3_ORF_typecomplete_len251_score40_63Asp_protease_2/PF13650_6/3_5e07gagasp_proteas/PF13975_6/8_5e06gagasp_proteas/PF13975_6/4_3e03Asp_protease/PF09668_10/1_7e05RVP/PF00077_20/0_0049RVP_2/PF08284_11/0_031DUF1758/PF05585_12/1_5e03DUF1758/PF05585_12/0_057MSC/PF09402_10/0_22_NODE_2580_length_2577_cov_117_228685_g1552_i37521504